jgi:hypothetical protein
MLPESSDSSFCSIGSVTIRGGLADNSFVFSVTYFFSAAEASLSINFSLDLKPFDVITPNALTHITPDLDFIAMGLMQFASYEKQIINPLLPLLDLVGKEPVKSVYI